MRHCVPCAVLLAVFAPLAARAQNPGDPQRAGEPSCPATATLDALVAALDDAVSGPANRDRTCLRQVMLPEARLSPMHRDAGGGFTPRLLSVDDWIAAVAKHGADAFYEVQVKVDKETYGHFAHLWSTYEIRDTPQGKATDSGINSIQAVFDGARWRVLSIVWEASATAGPVPNKYLP